MKSAPARALIIGGAVAAYAFLLLLLCVLFVSLMMRLFKVRLADIAR